MLGNHRWRARALAPEAADIAVAHAWGWPPTILSCVGLRAACDECLDACLLRLQMSQIRLAPDALLWSPYFESILVSSS